MLPQPKEIAPDLPKYTAALTDKKWVDDGFYFDRDGAFCAEISKFLSGRRISVFKKPQRVRALVDALDKELPLSARLSVPFGFKREAYMTDDGKLVLSFGLLARSGEKRIVKMIFHEAAHLYLASRPEYAQIKALDEMFLRQYGRGDDAIALSPIELYANDLACILAERTALAVPERKDALLDITAEERRKITDAISRTDIE